MKLSRLSHQTKWLTTLIKCTYIKISEVNLTTPKVHFGKQQPTTNSVLGAAEAKDCRVEKTDQAVHLIWLNSAIMVPRHNNKVF